MDPGNKDIISLLPDENLLHIFSYLPIRGRGRPRILNYDDNDEATSHKKSRRRIVVHELPGSRYDSSPRQSSAENGDDNCNEDDGIAIRSAREYGRNIPNLRRSRNIHLAYKVMRNSLRKPLPPALSDAFAFAFRNATRLSAWQEQEQQQQLENETLFARLCLVCHRWYNILTNPEPGDLFAFQFVLAPPFLGGMHFEFSTEIVASSNNDNNGDASSSLGPDLDLRTRWDHISSISSLLLDALDKLCGGRKNARRSLYLHNREFNKLGLRHLQQAKQIAVLDKPYALFSYSSSFSSSSSSSSSVSSLASRANNNDNDNDNDNNNNNNNNNEGNTRDTAATASPSSSSSASSFGAVKKCFCFCLEALGLFGSSIDFDNLRLGGASTTRATTPTTTTTSTAMLAASCLPVSDPRPLPRHPPSSSFCSTLKRLQLVSTTVDDAWLSEAVAQLPLLEELHVEHCTKLSRPRIFAPRLVHLYWDAFAFPCIVPQPPQLQQRQHQRLSNNNNNNNGNGNGNGNSNSAHCDSRPRTRLTRLDFMKSSYNVGSYKTEDTNWFTVNAKENPDLFSCLKMLRVQGEPARHFHALLEMAAAQQQQQQQQQQESAAVAASTSCARRVVSIIKANVQHLVVDPYFISQVLNFEGFTALRTVVAFCPNVFDNGPLCIENLGGAGGGGGPSSIHHHHHHNDGSARSAVSGNGNGNGNGNGITLRLEHLLHKVTIRGDCSRLRIVDAIRCPQLSSIEIDDKDNDSSFSSLECIVVNHRCASKRVQMQMQIPSGTKVYYYHEALRTVFDDPATALQALHVSQ